MGSCHSSSVDENLTAKKDLRDIYSTVGTVSGLTPRSTDVKGEGMHPMLMWAKPPTWLVTNARANQSRNRGESVNSFITQQNATNEKLSIRIAIDPRRMRTRRRGRLGQIMMQLYAICIGIGTMQRRTGKIKDQGMQSARVRTGRDKRLQLTVTEGVSSSTMWPVS
ncbi:hypothetical protein EVAR_22253_1 [Eumeta japonica]|uniref:Uncharacterized protein n=1 Tax=Eumeta variegata TaxID=151549 RepID=A0A4C1UAF6_EUMVA|nr:hypothetical protein EVAR_22253_1 [Eumeta japonica]